MEEPRRKRTPKKPEHPIREWFSDYLRYFLLAGAILVVLLVAVLAVKLFTGLSDKGAQTETKTESQVELPSKEESNADKDHTEQTDASETPAITPTEQPEKEETEVPSDADMTMEADSSMLTGLVKQYFDGLSARDPQAVSNCVDTFTEEDWQQVENNTQITSYRDVEVYTCEGTDAKSRVAFVSYRYTMAGSEAEIPALTQFYIYDMGNGDWKLAADASESSVQKRIEELSGTEEVQAMISRVQAEYDQVLAAHPELQ
ncbi:MAG: hypothetical protein Q4B85_09395 [Lachnospiraceae bacterium]|nr:hypothetical protein [Lachnospiraceae bacterium]